MRALAVSCVLHFALASPVAAGPPTRPTVAVMDFECATPTGSWSPDDLRRGVAARLVDTLVEDGRLRLIERSAVEAVLSEQDLAASNLASPDAATLARIGKALGVRYVVAGTITEFSASDRRFGDGTAGAVARGMLGPVGGLSFRKAKQEISLTARMIDTATGDVVVSTRGTGKARKGQGFAVEGGGDGEAGFSIESSEFRASGVAEAVDRAIAQLASGLLARVSGLALEPRAAGAAAPSTAVAEKGPEPQR